MVDVPRLKTTACRQWSDNKADWPINLFVAKSTEWGSNQYIVPGTSTRQGCQYAKQDCINRACLRVPTDALLAQPTKAYAFDQIFQEILFQICKLGVSLTRLTGTCVLPYVTIRGRVSLLSGQPDRWTTSCVYLDSNSLVLSYFSVITPSSLSGAS